MLFGQTRGVSGAFSEFVQFDGGGDVDPVVAGDGKDVPGAGSAGACEERGFGGVAYDGYDPEMPATGQGVMVGLRSMAATRPAGLGEFLGE